MCVFVCVNWFENNLMLWYIDFARNMRETSLSPLKSADNRLIALKLMTDVLFVVWNKTFEVVLLHLIKERKHKQQTFILALDKT